MSEEERPLREAREAMSQSAETPIEATLVTMPVAGESKINESSTPNNGRSPVLIYAGIALVVILILVALWLPPFSLGQRLAGNGEPETPAAAPELAPDNGLTIPGVFELAVSGPSEGVRVVQVSQAEFTGPTADASWQTAVAAIPAERRLQSDVFIIIAGEPDHAVTGQAAITIPSGAAPVAELDLMGWNGSRWVFVPHTVSGDARTITSQERALPQALALMQTGRPTNPSVAADLLPTQTMPTAVLPLLTEASVGGLTLNGGGQLVGDTAELPTGGYRQLLRVTNTGAIVDQVSLTSLLNDAAVQAAQIEGLVTRAATGGYAGVNLDYQGVVIGQRDAFTTFVTNLGRALNERGLILAVTLSTPTPVGNNWDSAGQDWAAIGQVADLVYAQMPLLPTSYGDNGPAEQLLAWSLRQIDRHKLVMSVSAAAISALGEAQLELSPAQALQKLGELDFVEGAEEIEPGTAVEVALSGSTSPIEWDTASLSYKYSFEENDQTYEVWLNNEAALSHRLRFANRYHLRGVAVRGLGAAAEDSDRFAAALEGYLGLADAPQPTGAALVWTVANEEGSVIASSSGSDKFSYTWQASDATGTFTIQVAFAQGEQVNSLGELTLVVKEPEPEPEPEEVVEEEVVEEVVVTPVPAQPAGPITPGTADAVANTVANVRRGPGLEFGIQTTLQTGERVSLIGRNSAASWLQIRQANETEGWVRADLLNVNTALNVNSLAVVAVEPPAAGVGPAPPPAPVAPPAAGGGSFELGGQTHTLGNPGLMRDVGMTWVKFQHKWGPGDDPAGLAGRISQAQANGFKVLLSIPGGLYPSSIDYSAYVDFLGGVAALGPNAIEIWNEQNIDREWPAGQISPANYVNQMLAPAYNRIKSVNRNVMVISGAPAPTGFFGGCGPGGCDDAPYMAGMAAAGAANYMDCIGIHYNEGIISPNQTSGDPRGGHYTRYFWGMTNTYWNAFGGSRPLCYTEIGYLSAQDYDFLPASFGWAANTTVGQHAQWLAEAVSLSANSGKVRMLIIFNVDFTYYTQDDPQAGYAMIRRDGSCPSCTLIRQVMGR
jgi:hypothetical protein